MRKMDKDADVETGGEQVSLETSHQTAVTDAALSITVKHKGPAFGNKNANEPLSSE